MPQHRKPLDALWAWLAQIRKSFHIDYYRLPNWIFQASLLKLK